MSLKHRMIRGGWFRLNCMLRHAFGLNSLEYIGRYFGTDKADKYHTFYLSYLDIYEKYFKELRSGKMNILEIGVRAGHSLRMWKHYFWRSNIYGIDIDPECKKLERKGIKIEIGSQDNAEFLARCFPEAGSFDIIIDDGSHINKLTIASFNYLFYNKLKNGGLYIIEDLQTSYRKLQDEHNIIETWPGMKYNAADMNFNNNRKDMDDFFKERLKNMDFHEDRVLFIHFWPMICIIGKTPAGDARNGT